MKKGKLRIRSRGQADLINQPKPGVYNNCNRLITDQDVICTGSTFEEFNWDDFTLEVPRRFSSIQMTEHCITTCGDCNVHVNDRPSHCICYYDDWLKFEPLSYKQMLENNYNRNPTFRFRIHQFLAELWSRLCGV